MKLRIVLVEPREAGNVGAVARAMKNFGFDDLVIVGEHPPLEPLGWWWASGASDIVERARFTATLLEAIGDAKLTIATTSSRGRSMPIDLKPVDVAELASTLNDDDVLALVFGREDSGLTRDEVVLCQRTAVVPTNERFPTMNLAQTVCVFCYELSSTERPVTPRERPTAELVERLHERVGALLLEIGFSQEDNPDRIYDDVRAMAGRADLDEREVRILLAMVRQVEGALRSSGATRPDTPRSSR